MDGMTMNRTESFNHAVVIGGSLAGLLSARVLSNHFKHVTVVERDALPTCAEVRKGVPQARHIHGLLVKGLDILTLLFPDLTASLRKSGSMDINMGADFYWHHFGCWKQRYQSEVCGLSLSRPYLDWEIRQRVEQLPNVEILDHRLVSGFLASPDRTRVAGVIFRRDATQTQEEALPADFVVDASGRGSQTPHYLETLGYERPKNSVVRINVGYASRLYRRPANMPDWKMLYIVPKPPLKRGGAIFPVEDRLWMVTLFGWLGDHPPMEGEGFLEYARSLPVPDLYQMIRQVEPVTPIVIHKLPSNLRRHYEKLDRLPEGLTVLGDALCSFNPIYGQGISVAATEALALDTSLQKWQAQRRDLRGFGKRFQKQVAKATDIPWQLATSEDLRYRDAGGSRKFGTDFVRWYSGKVHEAAARDWQVAEHFYRVMHMLAPPATLFHPSVIRRLLVKRARRAQTVTAMSG
jgi:2-polyprenyl-6-methoxyphenol hydroxylase-like FAD-dependent oxidoreductase